MKTIIRAEHLSKTFGSKRTPIRALDDVSLEIHEGEIIGVLGPNGAGKTTFLNILSTLLLPDSGRVEIMGIPLVPRHYNHLRQLFNMTSGSPNYPWSLTVEENLKFYGRLYGLRGQELTGRVKELIALFRLDDFAGRKFEELSSGTKQRLSLAKSLLNRPKILFLDEPTVGLDPDISIQIRQVILDLIRKTGVTALLTTHNMPEAEQLCKRIAFINKGKLIKLASPEEFKQSRTKKTLEEVFLDLAQQRTPLAGEAGSAREVDRPSTEWASVELPKKSWMQLTGEWLNRSWAFTCRNFLFAMRNFFAFAELAFWPVVTLISIGLLGNFLELKDQALAFILTGAITAGILQVTQLDVAYNLLYEVWSKSMKHTLLAPVGVGEGIFGSWLIGIARGLTIFLLLGLSAMAFFGYAFPPLGVTVVFLAGILSTALLLGLIVSIFVLSFGQKADITAWMLSYVFMLVCGIYYPIDTLPPFFYHVAQWIPITYFLEYFRASFGFTPLLSHGLLKGFALVAGYLIIGLWSLQRAFLRARRKGMIVRLSE